MKKIIGFILLLLFSVTIASCSNTNNNEDGNEYKDNEDGVPVDIAIAKADFYDYQKVIALIKNNQ